MARDLKKELYILSIWAIVAWLVWVFVQEYETPRRGKHPTELRK